MSELTEALAPALDVIRRDAEAVDEGRFPRAGIDALTDAGLMGLTVPPERSGTGPDPVGFAEVISAVAAECGSTAMVFLMHHAATAVVAAAPPAFDPGLVEALATGEKLGTLAFSEKGSRSHFWAPVSKALPDGDRIHLSGFKSWVTSANEADVFVASCGAVGGEGPTDSDLWVLDASTPGLTPAGSWSGLGLRGNDSGPMAMEVDVTADRRLGDAGGGFGLMMSAVLPWFCLGNASVSVGLARGALRAAIGHVSGTSLDHLQASLADLPTIRAHVARAEIGLRAAEALVRETARSIAAPDDGTMAAVLAVKAAGNETALSVTDTAMRVCGGAAFSKHLGVERSFRDARAGYVMAPTSDVLYEFLGRALCGLELF
jgi:alkylation response protein AidB-like acyl-CoA dehydrogenase